MLTAKEAREMFVPYSEERHHEYLLKKIEEDILLTTKNGMDFIQMSHIILPDPIVDKLKSLGYEVDQLIGDSKKGTISVVSISWHI